MVDRKANAGLPYERFTFTDCRFRNLSVRINKLVEWHMENDLRLIVFILNSINTFWKFLGWKSESKATKGRYLGYRKIIAIICQKSW